jgi:hypothetical protein
MSKASGRYRFPPPRTVPACHQWPVLTVEELKARVRAEATSVPAEVVEKILADWTGYAVLCEWQDGRCAVCGVSGVALSTTTIIAPRCFAASFAGDVTPGRAVRRGRYGTATGLGRRR